MLVAPKQSFVSEVLAVVERRKYLRVRREVNVRCRLAGVESGVHEALTLNIGAGGVCLRISEQFKAGQPLEVTFHDPRYDLSLVLSGLVAWTVTDGETGSYETGVQFPELTPSQQENVIALIGRTNGDSAEEQRRHVRLQRHLVVSLRRSRGLWRPRVLAAVVDISFGGMAVESEKPLRNMERYRAEIFLPTDRAPVLAITGCLDSRQNKDGTWLSRLEFEAMESEEAKRIGRFLSDQLLRPPA